MILLCIAFSLLLALSCPRHHMQTELHLFLWALFREQQAFPRSPQADLPLCLTELHKVTYSLLHHSLAKRGTGLRNLNQRG